MMDPSIYFRETERIEGEKAQHDRPKSLDRPAPERYRGYVREQLSSGCVLFRMIELQCVVKQGIPHPDVPSAIRNST